MKRQVSRRTDALPCSNCGDEPRRPGQRWGNACFAEYNRHERAMQKAGGYVRRTLSPEEWEAVKASRRAALSEPTGRHAAAAVA